VNAGEGLASVFSSDLRATKGERGGRALENLDGLPRFIFIGVGSGPKPPKPPVHGDADAAEKLAEKLAENRASRCGASSSNARGAPRERSGSGR
jgi:hypothetical protein